LSVGLNSALIYGEKLVLITGTGPEEILQTIERERISATFLVPTQAIAVINLPDLARFDLSSLKVVLCGAAHVPPELVRNIRSKLDCEVTNGYGMTEGLANATRVGDPLEVTCETVGRPICPGDEYRVVNEEGQVLPPGQEGELIARGPCIFRGYYKAAEYNRNAFNAEGFFFTGDLATFDHQGNLRITGRKKDMILRGGENISAEEIEELLITHPQVEEAAVVGMPDERLGERVCAYLRTRPGQTVTLEEAVSFLREQGIASFKFPERVELINEFPLTPVGKVSKKTLRERITREIDEERGMGAKG
jgi:non-ribosomal peptide synthetase component E (peptide arylation enzyme)